jgi:hypothetical protein
MDDGLIEDEHSGDAPPASFEHNSGARTNVLDALLAAVG